MPLSALSSSIRGLPPGCLQVLNETLGEGEVSARIKGDTTTEAQETAFPGMWRARVQPAGNPQPSQDTLEACAIPAAIRRGARGTAKLEFPPEPPGLMNAPALLLNTLEVSAMPDAARAAADDFADSIERLEECLVDMRET